MSSNRWFTAHHRLLLKRYSILLITSTLVALAILVYYGRKVIEKNISDQAKELASATKVEVTRRTGARLELAGMRQALATGEVRALCRWGEYFYAATSGGLLSFDTTGKLRNHYTTVDGLASNDLTSLAVYHDQLYIGSSDNGLIGFDGQQFSHYQFQKPVVRQISALLVNGELLMIGSFDAGLFSFDGTTFLRRDSQPISKITALLLKDSRIYVGSYEQGLFIWQEGRWQQLAQLQGLPSNRITALIGDEQGVLVATDFGISRLNSDNRLETFNTTPNITSLTRVRDKVWGGLFTGGFVEVVANNSGLNRAPSTDEWQRRGNTRLWSDTDGSLFALTNAGIWRADPSRAQFEFTLFNDTVKQSPLSAAHISAMALDGQNRLWIGYFDRGVDIFDPATLQQITHLEDQSIREINYLYWDRTEARMLVATAAGLAIYDDKLTYRLIDERAGISANSVSHVSVIRAANNEKERELLLATGRGMTILKGPIARTPISLPNNYLYTSAVVNGRVFVGSLGGLIEIANLQAVRTLTIANSKLSHNWINALTGIDGTLYIGTNGGGVDALLPSGELINFAGEIGKFDVNPNAMYSDQQRLYVGTLANGSYILDINSRKWQQLTRGLPSTNVTAIVGDEQYCYFGTTNGLVRFERGQLK